MSRIKSKDTSIELLIRKRLWKLGYRGYRVNYKDLPGKPDIVFFKKKVAIFCDSEFWHGYNWEEKKKKLKTNRKYWIKKIEGNIKRDREVNKKLTDTGWKVLRFWEKEIKNDLDKCIKIIIKTLDNRG